ncbi:MAG TPA: glycosyltransferase [Firmicutes bacterium]|nr:glycosyltransferase [Bacillota bacterium]
MSEELLRVLLREMPYVKGKKILECGSGSGRVSLRIASLGAAVTLLDKSAAALDLASRFSQQQGIPVSLVQADLFSMPFPDAYFDMVWNAGVLEHFQEAEQVEILKEMKRVSKPDGLVLAVVPHAGNPFYRVWKWWGEKTGRWVYGRENPATALGGVFLEAGLHVQHEYTADFYDSINLLGNIPGSETLKTLFQIWYEGLDEHERMVLPGRWLVTVGRVNPPVRLEKDSTEMAEPDGNHTRPAQSNQDCPPLYLPSISPSQSKGGLSVPVDTVHTGDTQQHVTGCLVSDRPPAVVCLSSIGWDELYQRPQQIMARLAEHGHKVLFVEPALRKGKLDIADVSPETIKVILHNDALQFLYRKAKGLYTFRALTQVEYGGGAGTNLDTLLASIQAACNLLGIEAPVWWVLSPLWYRTIEQLPGDVPLVYDCVDDHRHFAGVNPDAMGRLDRLLAKRANVVLATAKRLYREKAAVANTLYVPNGVDFEAYSRPPLCPPEDLKDIPGPRLGFSGAISNWVDVDLLYELASRRPDWHIIVVGSIYVDISKLLELPNFHYLGKKDCASLPGYLGCFDVGLIPFKPDHPLVISSNPIKLYEYLACGIPVVSARWDEVAEFEDVVSFADGTEGFISAVEALLSSPPPPGRLQDRAKAFHWDLIARIASRAVDLAVADSRSDGASMGRVLEDIERIRRCGLRRSNGYGQELQESLPPPVSYPTGQELIGVWGKLLEKQYDQALHLLEDLSEGNTPDLVCELGSRLHDRGLDSHAIALFERAVCEYAKDPDLMYNLAVLLVERNLDGDRECAVDLLNTILRHRPQDEGAQSLLNAVLVLQENVERATIRSPKEEWQTTTEVLPPEQVDQNESGGATNQPKYEVGNTIGSVRQDAHEQDPEIERVQWERRHFSRSLKEAAAFVREREGELKAAARLADSIWSDLTDTDTIRPMKIGYYFVHEKPTGGMRVVVEQVNQLVEMGHDVTVFYRTHESSPIMPDWIQCNPSRVVRVPLEARLHEVLGQVPDIEVLVGTFWTQLWELMQCTAVNVVYYEQGHENLYDDPNFKGLQVPFEIMIRLPVPLMAVSHAVNEALARRGRQGILVNPGVSGHFRPFTGKHLDGVEHSPAGRLHGRQPAVQERLAMVEERPVRILLVGSASLAFKGFDTVIEALGHLKERGHEFEVVWVSPTPQPQDAAFPFRCSWVTNPPQDILAAVMRRTDILLSGSHYEAFSLPPLEAMASGVAVVATDNGGIREYAKPGPNCLLVPPRSPDSMMNSIEKLLSDHQLRARLVVEGLKTANSFRWPKQIRTLEKVLSRLVSMGHSR